MISFEEAKKIIHSHHNNIDSETIPLNESLGRMLAEDILSDVNMPPFNKSAVDGYACRKEDLNHDLILLETIPAGQVPSQNIILNTCSKIMTGAQVPEGADMIFMVEHSEENEDGTIRFNKDKSNQNICFLGEDVIVGQKILSKGRRIKPQDIAMLASVGKDQVKVSRKLKIGVIATGSELVEPDQIPGPGQIRNSNAYQIIAQINELDATPNYIGIANDSESALYEKIKLSLDNNDMTILSGGVSMGDFDYVPKVLSDLGVQIQFKSISVQPGKPTLFGVKSPSHFVFGLPGNPVSSFVQFNLLVKPFLFQLMGTTSQDKTFRLPIGFNYKRKKANRDKWEPGMINEHGQIVPIDYHGSAHIHALSFADIIFKIPIDVYELQIGDFCDARPI